MILIHENNAIINILKPVICPKCTSGKLANISSISEIKIIKNFNKPLNQNNDIIQVKCPTCKKLWLLTIK